MLKNFTTEDEKARVNNVELQKLNTFLTQSHKATRETDKNGF